MPQPNLYSRTLKKTKPPRRKDNNKRCVRGLHEWMPTKDSSHPAAFRLGLSWIEDSAGIRGQDRNVSNDDGV